MNAACCICGDLFSASDDIYAAPCGHAFHHACLLQWVERSKSCPQCRKRTDADSLLRIYFNFPTGEGIALDAVALQARLDEAEFERAASGRALREAEREAGALRKSVADLESEVSSLKRRIDAKGVALEALKARVEYAKADAREAARLRSENAELLAKLDVLRGLQTAIDGTAAEVEAAMRNSPDPKRLATFVAVLKKSVLQAESKKRALRDELRALRGELDAANAERNETAAKCKSAETLAAHFESKYDEVRRELAEYKVDDSTLKNCADAGESESSAVKLKRSASDADDRGESFKTSRISTDFAEPSGSVEKTTNESEATTNASPYLCLKRNAGIPAGALRGLPSKSNGNVTTDYYIFKNKKLSDNMTKTDGLRFFKSTIRKQEQMETVYDGLGGHAKADNFPTVSPKKLTKKNLVNFKKKL